MVMWRRDKRKSAKREIKEDQSGSLDSKTLEKLSSSDDEEANEDLSLKIVDKALSVNAARLSERNDTRPDGRDIVSVVDLACSMSLGGSDMAGTCGGGEEADLDSKSKKIVKRRRKKMKFEKVILSEDGDRAEIIEKVETVERAEMAKAAKAVASLDCNTRGPRYFDPPDIGWVACYNCGEEGHMAVNCTSSSKRKKPCFVCGSLDHGARQCSKREVLVTNFFPGKWNDYSNDDLKDIQCYVCKNFGHLCCVSFVDTSTREVSCYRCGQKGHSGPSCSKSRGETKETTDNGSPSLCSKCGEGGHFARECTTGTATSSLCYKCGEGGHFARECIASTASSSLCHKCGGGGHFARECSSAKVGKRNHDSSTPNVRPHRENKEFLGYKSAPHDHRKSPKRKKMQYEEEGLSMPRKQNKEVVGLQRILEISPIASPKGAIGILTQHHIKRDKESLCHLLLVVYQVPNLLNQRILIDLRHQGSAILAIMNQGGFIMNGRLDLCLDLT
ncbi:hypothetical protein PTKIN_Ptkin06aG0131900 [Pterospermum kingtungense]